MYPTRRSTNPWMSASARMPRTVPALLLPPPAELLPQRRQLRPALFQLLLHPRRVAFRNPLLDPVVDGHHLVVVGVHVVEERLDVGRGDVRQVEDAGDLLRGVTAQP